MQVSIAKQLKSVLGIEDSVKIGYLTHVRLMYCCIQRKTYVLLHLSPLCTWMICIDKHAKCHSHS